MIGVDEAAAAAIIPSIKPNDWQRVSGHHAARLEGLAEPGAICVSARVQEDSAGKLDLGFEDMGEESLKNVAGAVRFIGSGWIG